MKIGLLGGSFNPAHYGHKKISEAAINQLGLDKLWWVITPCNPLKEKKDIGSLKERVDVANQVKANKQIIVKKLEDENSVNYSYLLIDDILSQYPEDKFYWLMGADNLVNFSQWRNWHEIANKINILVFPRNGLNINNSEFFQNYGEYFIPSADVALLTEKKPPYWSLLDMEEVDISSTEIRKKDVCE